MALKIVDKFSTKAYSPVLSYAQMHINIPIRIIVMLSEEYVNYSICFWAYAIIGMIFVFVWQSTLIMVL